MIQIKDLKMVYPGGFTGLHPTSIQFKQAEFTVLLGSSGAGKSTLLRCLNFLNTPTSGSVMVKGLGVITRDKIKIRALRKQTGMIFQQHQLIGTQTAIKNVMAAFLGRYTLGRSLFPAKKEDIHFGLECLERVSLLDKAFTRVDSLSGGQQQRVGIARALAQRPRMILADEPVASLDPESSKEVLSLLYKITKEDGISAIVSLHQVELAMKFADRLIGVAGGRVVFDDTPDRINKKMLAVIYPKKKEIQPEIIPFIAADREFIEALKA